MHKKLLALLFLLSLFPLFSSLAAEEKSFLLEETNDAGAMSLARLDARVISFINYSSGEGNSERYFKIYISDYEGETWNLLPDSGLPTNTSGVSMGQVKSHRGYLYTILSRGLDHETTEIWRTPYNDIRGWECLSEMDVNFGNIHITPFQKKLYFYGSNLSSSEMLKGWRLKNDGSVEEVNITLPFSKDFSSPSVRYSFVKGNALYLGLWVNNKNRLLRSENGSDFSLVKNFPYKKKLFAAEEFTKTNKWLFFGGENAIPNTVIWRTKNMQTWKKDKTFKWESAYSYDLDLIKKTRGGVYALLQYTTIQDPGHPTLLLYIRQGKMWKQEAEWINTYAGSDLLSFKGKTIIALSCGDGPKISIR